MLARTKMSARGSPDDDSTFLKKRTTISLVETKLQDQINSLQALDPNSSDFQVLHDAQVALLNGTVHELKQLSAAT
jgi:hypothetical protein